MKSSTSNTSDRRSPRALQVTLLVEDFRPLVQAAGGGTRHRALERIVARGRPRHWRQDSADHLRFHLFGIEPGHLLPVAALTRAGDRESLPGRDCFWLRTDPVTMWADMARVVMTSHGA